MKKLMLALLALGATVQLQAFRDVHFGKMEKQSIYKAVQDSRKKAAKSVLGKKLIKAAMLGDLKQVKHLVSSGASVNMADNNGNTPLIYACMNASQGSTHSHNYNLIAVMLIAHGAHVNVIGSEKMTPLMWSVMNGQSRIVQFLLTKGAHTNVRNYQGYTPLSLAVEGAHLHVLQILLQSKKIQINKDYKEQLIKLNEQYHRGLKSNPPAKWKKVHEEHMQKLKIMISLLKKYVHLGHQKSLSHSVSKNVISSIGRRHQCPRGSYKKTCGMCSCTDSEMTCYCLSEKGSLRKSTVRTNLKKDEMIAVNKNGILERKKR